MGSQPLIRSNLYIITYVTNLPTENSVGVATPQPPPTLAPLNGGMHSRKILEKESNLVRFGVYCILIRLQ